MSRLEKKAQEEDNQNSPPKKWVFHLCTLFDSDHFSIFPPGHRYGFGGKSLYCDG